MRYLVKLNTVSNRYMVIDTQWGCRWVCAGLKRGDAERLAWRLNDRSAWGR